MMTFICFCLVSACKVEKSWMQNLVWSVSCVEMEGKLWMKNPVRSGSPQEDRGYMALNSLRQDSKVVPEKGVYVEMEGIIIQQ